MFIVRPLSNPVPQAITETTYSVLSGSDVVIEAIGNATAKLKLKYNFSFAAPAAESGSMLCKLQYSLQPSGFAAYWQTVASTRPFKITAGQPFRASFDIPHTLLSGIPAGYELQYRAMVALEGGSGPITVHDSSISPSAYIEVAQGDSNVGVIRIYALAAVGVSAEAWGGVAILMRADAAVGVSAEAWGGVATLLRADAGISVYAEAVTDYTDPIRIKPPQVTEPIVQTLEADWKAVSGTTILIEERVAGWLPHFAALSFHVPFKPIGTSGGEADFKVMRSVNEGVWEDIPLAIDSWSGDEGLAVLGWTIDQTAGIPSNTSVRYRLYGKFATAGYEVEVNSTGKPGATYLPDFEV